MALSLDGPIAIDGLATTAPTILPICLLQETDRRADWPPRFEFPAIEPMAEDIEVEGGPEARWPACDTPAVARACAELAQSLAWKLAPKQRAIWAFCSPGQNDGKTSLLVGLAPELAKRVEGNVLVVDANFRNRNLLRRLTSDTVDAEDLESGAPCATDVPGLGFLSAEFGPQFLVCPDGAWLDHLHDQWRVVLVDMASFEFAESAAMLRHCDGVFLVVRVGHTARRAVREAARLIRRAGGRLIGSIAVA